MFTYRKIIIINLTVLVCYPAAALERKDVTFQVFQFPANMIPRIDGDPNDWSIVPDEYVIGTDQLVDDNGRYQKPDPNNLDVRVRVGWVKGMNRLYFLYEAYDNYWDFSLPGLHNDTFEVVVDGDASGGPLIDKEHSKVWVSEEVGAAAIADDRISDEEANWAIHGVHAQNYHIFTPAEGKDWALAWGVQPWIKELPFANAVCNYDFKPGESGRLVLEFWITPFDYAGPEGPARAAESVLRENKIIGLCWAVIDYDDVNSGGKNNGFWNLSRKHKMYGNASHLCAFRLMPLEKKFLKSIKAQWSFKILDMDRRLVAFKDLSYGNITSWKWDFGDGTTSTAQHPLHQYKKPGSYVVVLDIEGPRGKSRRSKVWDVTVK
jgi:hypothetical protein